ncbi:Uncharacterised protein [Achromobacter xylosoxidans]|nr:Uncharacterised protein [Achromobacter xylosoxidans]
MAAGRRTLAPVKALEDIGQVRAGDADTGIPHGQDHLIAAVAQGHVDRSPQGVLERVGQQVQHDSFVPVAIDEHGGHRVALYRQGQPRALHRRSERAGVLLGGAGQVGGLQPRHHAAPFDTRKIQQRVHQLLQAQRIAQQQFQRLAFQACRRLRQRLLQRSENQRERRPELVADVGKKNGLGAIQLRQDFGAPSLLLIGDGAGDGAGRMLGDQVEEVAVGAIQRPPRTDAQHHDARDRAVSGPAQRQDARPCGQIGPGPAWQCQPQRRQRHGLRFAIAGDGSQGPVGCRARLRIHAGRGKQFEVRVAASIEQAERHVARVARQHIADTPRRGGRPGGRHRLRAELAQGFQTPRADDLLGGLGAGAENALDGDAVRRQDRAVGEGDVDFFARQVAVEIVFLVVGPGSLAAAIDTRKHGADFGPDLAPAFLPGPAKRRRMLVGAQERNIGIVVQDAEILAPPEQDGKAGTQAQAQCRAQILRPQGGRPDRSRVPIQLPQMPRDLALIWQEFQTRVELQGFSCRKEPPDPATARLGRMLRWYRRAIRKRQEVVSSGNCPWPMAK